MTQAHKTVGALVEAHPDVLPDGVMGAWYSYYNLEGRVFEVLDSNAPAPGHTKARDIITGEIIGMHSENFKTIDTTKQCNVKRKNMPR